MTVIVSLIFLWWFFCVKKLFKYIDEERLGEENMIVKKCANGITLINLVVTIVILLILAGISINIGFGENGFVKQSQEIVKKTEKEKFIEDGKKAYIEVYTEKQRKEGINVTVDILEVLCRLIEEYRI